MPPIPMSVHLAAVFEREALEEAHWGAFCHRNYLELTERIRQREYAIANIQFVGNRHIIQTAITFLREIQLGDIGKQDWLRAMVVESNQRLRQAEVGVGDFIELKVTDYVQMKKKLKLMISLKLSLKMDLSDYEVSRVLVTCRSIDIANMINDESFAQLYDDDAVGLCCLGILQLVILGVESTRVVPDWMLRLANDRTWILESYRVTAIMYFDRYNRYPIVAAWNKKKGRFLGPMVIPFFEGNMLAARLTPDDNEARSDWWISSMAYFDGFICQVERVPFDLSLQNMYEIPSDIYREFDEQKREIERNKKEVDNMKEEMRKFKEEMNVQPVRQENNEPIITDQHYGLSDFTQFQSTQMTQVCGSRDALPSLMFPLVFVSLPLVSLSFQPRTYNLRTLPFQDLGQMSKGPRE
ncbi:hypothetical protein Tco_0705094 [Tanacetum coccineum]|uniref:Uncharacterized protein n=1 Tax=Tanacetum coccineum TaxID=301880 RepID=A0ABQ4Y3L5_9ASTR